MSYADALTGKTRDTKYADRIKASKKAFAEAELAMRKACFDCIKEEARIRGHSTCELPKGTEAVFCYQVCLEVPVQNGKARIAVELDDDSYWTYTARELNGHFMEQTPSFSGPMIGQYLLTSAETPCELFDNLLTCEAQYPVGIPPSTEQTCTICGGNGRMVASYGRAPCPYCDGTGVISLL